MIVVVTAAETVVHGGPAAYWARRDGIPSAPRAPTPCSRPAPRKGGSWPSRSSASSAPGTRDRRLVDAQPPAPRRRRPRLPVRAGGARPNCGLRVPPAVRAAAGLDARPDHPLAATRALPQPRPYGGPPSVAHAEALLRGVETRSATLEGQLDAIVIGIPRTTPFLPRERPNPLLAAYLRARARLCGCGVTGFRWSRAEPRSSCTGSTGTSPTRRSSRTARSFRRPRAWGASRSNWWRPSRPP